MNNKRASVDRPTEQGYYLFRANIKFYMNALLLVFPLPDGVLNLPQFARRSIQTLSTC